MSLHLLPLAVSVLPAVLLSGVARPAPPETAGTVRSADGVPIHYVVQGRGEPALVFVHGWAIDGGYWRDAMAAFAPRHRVVALDLAGHGRSGAGRKDWTMPAFAEDVRAVVRALDLKRVILVGHSMSGNVILEAARLLPDCVVGLVPVDTLLDPDDATSEADIAAMTARFRADFPGTLREFASQYLFVPAMDPKLRDAIIADMASRPPAIAVPMIEQAWRYDPRPALSEITVPIVAVNADKYPTRLDALRRYAPRYDAVLVHGVGHYPMREDPAGFQAALAEALARIERAAPARR